MGFFKEVVTEFGLSYLDNSAVIEWPESIDLPSPEGCDRGRFEKDIFTLDLFGPSFDGDAQFVKGR